MMRLKLATLLVGFALLDLGHLGAEGLGHLRALDALARIRPLDPVGVPVGLRGR